MHAASVLPDGRCEVSKGEEFQPWLIERGIEDVEALVPDMAGAARGKVLPAGNLGNGELKLPEVVFSQTVSGDYIKDENNVEDNVSDIDAYVVRLHIPSLLLGAEMEFLTNLVGDFDDDDDVDTGDICMLQMAIMDESTDAIYDLDANGFVEFADLEIMIEVILMTKFGDANLDLKVDAQDLNINGLNWQQSPRWWGEGNFSVDDTKVDAQDLNKIALNWGFGT